MSITLSNNKPIPSFIDVKKKGEIAVYSNSAEQIGLYAVKFSGCYQFKQASFYQGIDVRMNTAPIMNMSQIGVNHTFEVGKPWQLVLPQIKDNESNSDFQVIITQSQTNRKSSKLPYFMKYTPSTQALDINPRSVVDVGNYLLYLRVQEIDAPLYFTDYILNITIVKSNVTVNSTEDDYEIKPLKGYIKSNPELKYGVIIIKFN